MGKPSDRLKKELISLEERLFDNSVRTDPLRIAEILEPGCVEIRMDGSQDTYRPGEAFTRVEGMQYIDIESALLLDLSDDCKLLSYIGSRVVKNVRSKSSHSSVWKKAAGGWKIVFHQGTLRAPSA
jgi:hypothetical protein